ncbi:MAG TPA: PAS domain S-box protein [Polyangia bacterium]|nr:PAS domain S-box protein [Polyangia bacterium]
MNGALEPDALDSLAQAAQVLAVGTGESQLHAAVEHVARALGATSVSLFALLSDPEAAYLVADSGADDASPVSAGVRWSLDQHPNLRRAVDDSAVSVGPDAAGQTTATVPVLVGGRPAGVLVARFPGDDAARAGLAAARVAGSMLGIVIRGAKALDPLRGRTRRITQSEVREEGRIRAIERYRAFIDSASDGIFVLDAAGLVLYMNRAAEEMTGYARDGLGGKPIAQIVPEAFRPGLAARIERAIAAEPVHNFDLELVTTSGDRIAVSVASIAVLSEHEAAIFSFRDVTLARELERELRRTSEFLNRILNSAVDGIIAANMRGTIVLFNQGAERICGYKASDVIGKISVKRLYPPGVAREVMHLIRSAEHGGGGRLEPVRRELLSAGGERVPVSISAALVLDDDGREIATVGVFSDLRDRIRMEERLATAQEKLAISQKQAVAVELAGAAAHELNQPLTSVMGYAQVLIRKLGPDDAHLPIARTILEEADRMAAIVRKLGSLTRYETKSYVGGAQIIDLDRAAQENFSGPHETGKKEDP